jgi:hypothetical protein
MINEVRSRLPDAAASASINRLSHFTQPDPTQTCEPLRHNLRMNGEEDQKGISSLIRSSADPDMMAKLDVHRVPSSPGPIVTSLFTSVLSELRRINPFQMPGSRVALWPAKFTTKQ